MSASTSGQGDSAARVRRFLTAHGLEDGLSEFAESTKTAEEAAAALGCELGQVVKSLVITAGEPVMVLVAGDRRADFDAVAEAMGTRRARMAHPTTVEELTGYATGGVCPFDLPEDIVVLIDDSLTRFDSVYPAAGTACSMVRVTLEQLTAITAGRLARISH